jgi:hypothetical protein
LIFALVKVQVNLCTRWCRRNAPSHEPQGSTYLNEM